MSGATGSAYKHSRALSEDVAVVVEVRRERGRLREAHYSICGEREFGMGDGVRLLSASPSVACSLFGKDQMTVVGSRPPALGPPPYRSPAIMHGDQSRPHGWVCNSNSYYDCLSASVAAFG